MPKPDLTHWKDMAAPPLPRAGCAVAVIDGELVVAGGTYWRDGQKYWSERVDAFDPTIDRWSPRASLAAPLGDAGSAVYDGTLYVFGGGATGVAESAVWALQDNRWSEVRNLALPAPRRSASVALVDGIFYVLGGMPGTASDFAGATSTLWAAKPDGRWEARAPIPGPARFNLSVGVVAGRMIVAGGCTPEAGGVRNLDEVLAYDPAADAWTTLGPLPLAIRAAGCLVEDESLLLFGGYTDTFATGILRYEVPRGRVESVGRLPVGLAGAHFRRVGGRILGVTGENGVKMRFPGTLSSS